MSRTSTIPAIIGVAWATLLGGCLFVAVPIPVARTTGSSNPATDDTPAPARSAAATTSVPAKVEPAADDPAPNEFERKVAEMLVHDPGQRRSRLVYNPILGAVARQRATDMAQRDYFDHVDPDGRAANYYVEKAGFRLPDFYDHSPSGNNIESIAGGDPTPESAWQGWMSSPPHRTHLLGLEPFYQSQTEFGVGYARRPGTQFEHYWVVLIAAPRQ